MRRDLVVVALISLAIAPSLTAAETKQARRSDGDEMREAAAMIASIAGAMQHAGARRGEAAGLLKEAVRTGSADAETFATIADWILYEKEEKVAAGVADMLVGVLPAAGGPEAAQWNQTAQAMIGLFTGLLRDAQTNRRVSSAEAHARMETVIAAATPAVTAALREAGLDACVVDAAADALKKIDE
jgi:hypothetical protein